MGRLYVNTGWNINVSQKRSLLHLPPPFSRWGWDHVGVGSNKHLRKILPLGNYCKW